MNLTNHKNRLTKWFLAATLILGIFVSGGYSANQQAKGQTAQVELLASKKRLSSHRTTSYHKALGTLDSNLFYHLIKNQAITRLAFDRAIKVCLDEALRRCSHYILPNPFPQTKTIPLSFREPAPETSVS